MQSIVSETFMGRVIKVIVPDKDYDRIMQEHPNIEEDIRQYLGCSETLTTDREYAIDKIRSFAPGTIFSFRDVFDNSPRELTSPNARLVRCVCRELKLAERYGYDSTLKVKTYRRLNDVN